MTPYNPKSAFAQGDRCHPQIATPIPLVNMSETPLHKLRVFVIGQILTCNQVFGGRARQAHTCCKELILECLNLDWSLKHICKFLWSIYLASIAQNLHLTSDAWLHAYVCTTSWAVHARPLFASTTYMSLFLYPSLKLNTAQHTVSAHNSPLIEPKLHGQRQRKRPFAKLVCWKLVAETLEWTQPKPGHATKETGNHPRKRTTRNQE